ncbi:transporter substrate-binding domain-containing protein [Desulfolutivibrio sulfoxidireducens]|uniref:transporter substrate-binding domain-containing protein n=1 Tax=Desulfolutivibrio sulfoxidireducens TaxID=2773299 RepID=UPI00159E2B87|nr:transporter substrate-binding domain-containing protein [Desulfolutivibrio sulfoxidireducens]QLA15277.1 transporter substrate-binding domain-containing protein [Desulfolutivibrio sulfoxidireducens]QLA18849.1 transporter substrate-binding domain-containing protein [Desulfolutivibrio sulfoxidireducens]
MIRFIRIILTAFVALTLCCGLSFAASPYETSGNSTLAAIAKRGTLVVGMELKFWPFEYVSEKGDPVGFDVDVAGLIAKELGVKLEIKDMEWTGLIPALQAGKIDLIISGITGTLERAKSITFTRPYFTTGLCALISTKKAPGITSVAALDDPSRIIAVKTGTTADLTATKRFPKAKINRYKEETACVQEVANGRADAFFYDQISIAKHHKQNPETTTALLTPFTYEPFCIALQKGDFDLWQWLDMFLETVKSNGSLDELRRKHFGDLLR